MYSKYLANKEIHYNNVITKSSKALNVKATSTVYAWVID